MRLDISNSWTPTAENINTLPEPLRRYIHDLQANADLAETMRENFRLWREIAVLKKEIAVKASERERPAFSNDLDIFYFGSERS
ncbi:MAG TPA: hypothetical protein VMI47_10775 [Pseudolabrys sp.]|nr:hypothetical protein [Pseudolabrys sp.]